MNKSECFLDSRFCNLLIIRETFTNRESEYLDTTIISETKVSLPCVDDVV